MHFLLAAAIIHYYPAYSKKSTKINTSMAADPDRSVPDDLPDPPKDTDVPVPVNGDEYEGKYIIHVANEMRKASKGALDGYSRYDPVSYIKKGSRYCIRVKVDGDVLLDIKGRYAFSKASRVSKPVQVDSIDAPMKVD